MDDVREQRSSLQKSEQAEMRLPFGIIVLEFPPAQVSIKENGTQT